MGASNSSDKHSSDTGVLKLVSMSSKAATIQASAAAFKTITSTRVLEQYLSACSAIGARGLNLSQEIKWVQTMNNKTPGGPSLSAAARLEAAHRWCQCC
jgi:hypothetical protein